jgi:hypothetical protein
VVIRIVAIAVLASGCVELAAPQIHTRSGSVPLASIHRIVALPATCGSLAGQLVPDANGGGVHPEQRECPPAALDGIDQAIRARFDFAGFQVIDSATVNAATASRREVIDRSGGDSEATTERVVATFDDATPVEQAAILHQLGADALLSARVWVGADIANGSRRSVSVQIRLVTADRRALVWERRCVLETGLELEPATIDRGARCAMEGAGR